MQETGPRDGFVALLLDLSGLGELLIELGVLPVYLHQHLELLLQHLLQCLVLLYIVVQDHLEHFPVG